MKTKKITQKEIAEKLNITQGAVSGWLNGNIKPSLKNAKALNRAFPIIPIEVCDNLPQFVKDNSQLFGRIKILRGADNGIAKV